MSEAMKAEFDTVAGWTAEVAQDLGPDHHLPAACRGSGSPGVLRWLVDRLAITSTDHMLDCGAGVGGPAAFAAAEAGVRPVLTDPEAGACRAARQLFGLPVVQAASALPFASASFDVVWSLGVLCTVSDQPGLLADFARVLRAGGRLGLLVFVKNRDPLPEQPEGNDFPTPAGLAALLGAGGFRIINSGSAADFTGVPSHWAERTAAVEAELERRHGDDPLWRTAQRQSALIGKLLARGDLTGELVFAQQSA